LQSRLLPPDEALAELAELESVLVGTVLQDALAALEAQIEAVEFRVVFLELLDDAQRLQIVLESAEVPHAFVERILAGVSERGVPEIVGETDRFGQHFVELERARDGAGDLRHRGSGSAASGTDRPRD